MSTLHKIVWILTGPDASSKMGLVIVKDPILHYREAEIEQ